MPRRRHPHKEIEAALAYAEQCGSRVEPGGSHAWGKMKCPCNDGHCGTTNHCSTSIWSTPTNAGNHAQHLRRIDNRCRPE